MAQALQAGDGSPLFAALFPGIAVRTAKMRLFLGLFVSAALLAACGDEENLPDVNQGDVAPSDVGRGDAGAGDDVGDVETSDGPGDGESDTEAEPPQRCNGYAELCDRPFDEVVLLGTHNAMANAADGFIAPNHNLSIPDQLALGVRAMLIDVYRQDDELLLCHGSCGFGSSDAIAQLSGIVAFLNEHPNDVMAFIFEDRVDAADMATLVEASGLADLALLPPEDGNWPTLREMVERGTRVVLTVESGDSATPSILPAWDVYFDTPYSFASVDEFSCDLNRGRSDNALFLMNHWVSNPLPDPFFAPEANAYDVLLSRAEACAAEQSRLPHVIAVDFVEIGDALEVVDVLNGVRPRR